jgi:hypothetical protein
MNLNDAERDAGWADTLCAHLRLREEALLDPALRRDRARVAAFLADDFLEFGSSGNVWTREAVIELLATEKYQPPTMEDFKCHWIAEGVALVTYRTVRIDPQSGQSAAVLRSSLWVRDLSEWRMRFHQGTRVP